LLDRSHRLTTSAGFASVVRTGHRAGTRTLVLHLGAEAGASSESEAPPRVGFVVGKAVGNAVTRNLVKRRLRHLVRERLGSLPASADVVVRALPAAALASYVDLGVDLDAAVRRLARAGAR
jgi:ribonuclease P protein component